MVAPGGRHRMAFAIGTLQSPQTQLFRPLYLFCDERPESRETFELPSRQVLSVRADLIDDREVLAGLSRCLEDMPKRPGNLIFDGRVDHRLPGGIAQDVDACSSRTIDLCM